MICPECNIGDLEEEPDTPGLLVCTHCFAEVEPFDIESDEDDDDEEDWDEDISLAEENDE